MIYICQGLVQATESQLFPKREEEMEMEQTRKKKEERSKEVVQTDKYMATRR